MQGRKTHVLTCKSCKGIEEYVVEQEGVPKNMSMTHSMNNIPDLGLD